jgi:hypothetical protein
MSIQAPYTADSLVNDFELLFRAEDFDDSLFGGENDSSVEISGLELLDDEDFEGFLFEDANDSVEYNTNLDKVLYKDEGNADESCDKLRDGIHFSNTNENSNEHSDKSQPCTNHKFGENKTSGLTSMLGVNRPGTLVLPYETQNNENWLSTAMNMVSYTE